MGIDIAEFINDGGNVASQKITFVAMDFAGQVWNTQYTPYLCFYYSRKNTSSRITVLLHLAQSMPSAAKLKICLRLVSVFFCHGLQ